MKIVFASSEVFPFSKTGGLADVVGSLAKEMVKLNNDVIVITPYYKSVMENFPEIKNTEKKVWVDVPSGLLEFEIFTLKESGIEFVFFKNDELFLRNGFYNENGLDYQDNPVRFASFSMALMNYLKHHNINPDIIHCNDWQTSLIPVYHKSYFSDLKAKTILTIHNLAFQGIFDIDLKYIGLDDSFFDMEKLEFYGKINFLKGGIVYSDFITTVSPTYAEEIKTMEYGFRLDGLLRHYSHKLKGILNGIDYEYWNPLTDKYIYKNFDNHNDKKINKFKFTEHFELNNDYPLFVMVSRFTEQKGLNMILHLREKFSQLNASFIFLGDGTPEFNEKMKILEHINSNIRVILGYKEQLSHILYASSDFYLMPSVFEPCGLSQMIAMRYGSVPIVRKTGGLNDTVKDIAQNGYGFVFDEINSDALLSQINRALDYYNSNDISYLSEKVMKIDFSWKESAKKYVQLYLSLVNT